MEQETGSKLGKEYVKAVYCHRAYLIYMQCTSCKMPGWMKHKLESRFLGKISITSDMQMTLKSLLMKVKEESEKVGLKNGNSDRLYFWRAPKSLQIVTTAMKLKGACSLEEKL